MVNNDHWDRSPHSTTDDCTLGRRGYLKATTVGLGTLLAGCSGDGGSGETNTEATEAEAGGGGDGGGTTKGDQGQDFSGITIDYWDLLNIQSQAAREGVQKIIETFQKETGATVNLNMSGVKQLSGQKWLQAWKNENYPVAFNAEDFYFGRIIATGHSKPFDEYKSQIDDEAIDGMQWAMDAKRSAYRFWDVPGDSGVINIPHAASVRNPLTVRKDKLEQAGHSLDDIPDTGDAVQDFEQLMQLAQSVQENSDVKNGFQAHGGTFDYNDNMAPFMSAEDPQGSRYISEDGTEAYPSDLWTPWLDRYTSIQHEYGVSNPQTPSLSDEEAATQLYAGDAAMGTVEMLNYPTLIDRAPDVMEAGDLQILPYPGGNSDAPGHIGFHDSGLNKKPSNADSQRWERKVQVGAAITNRFLGERIQTNYPDMVGWLGIRDDLRDQTEATYGEATNFFTAYETLMDAAEVTWPYHRYSSQIIFQTFAPYVQKALSQEIPAEEAMSQARSESNSLIQQANDELGEPGNWAID